MPNAMPNNQTMTAAQSIACAECGQSHLVHRHDVSVHNKGALNCPSCKGVLIQWSGLWFYTLVVSPPKSSPDMPVLNE